MARRSSSVSGPGGAQLLFDLDHHGLGLHGQRRHPELELGPGLGRGAVGRDRRRGGRGGAEARGLGHGQHGLVRALGPLFSAEHRHRARALATRGLGRRRRGGALHGRAHGQIRERAEQLHPSGGGGIHQGRLQLLEQGRHVEARELSLAVEHEVVTAAARGVV
ncbi:MAG: hypothetical protein IPO67_12635 [Deltaproteobacteria bacterium]|nr:hypothetical protein [Deltaproteobacteria bacterium]